MLDDGTVNQHKKKSGQNLFLQRRIIVTIFALALVVFETDIILHNVLDLGEPSPLLNFLTYALAISLVVVVSLGLIHTKFNIIESSKNLDHKYLLQRETVNVGDWDELSNNVLRFISDLIPSMGASIMVYDQIKDKYDQVAVWSRDGATLPVILPSPAEEYCSTCMVTKTPGQSNLIPCCCPLLMNSGNVSRFRPFCLPLLSGDSPVGVLLLFAKSEVLPEMDGVEILLETASDLALAVGRLKRSQALLNHIEVVEREQKRLAIYLHDTIGHDLAYLQIKLHQIHSNLQLKEEASLSRDIKGMLNVTDQSYNHIRNLLAILRSESTSNLDLHGAIRDSAAMVASRSNLEFIFREHGNRIELLPHTKRQILYLIREILWNIEKHAQARRLEIDVIWQTDHLVVMIHDDGQGLDFRKVRNQHGHYGLRIIEECLAELRGTIEVDSTAIIGTKVTLKVPIINNYEIISS